MKKSRLRIRGDEGQDLVASDGGSDKARHSVSTVLFIRVQKKDLYKVVKELSRRL